MNCGLDGGSREGERERLRRGNWILWEDLKTQEGRESEEINQLKEWSSINSVGGS